MIEIDVHTNKKQIIGEGYIEKISNLIKSVLPSKNELVVDYSTDEKYINAVTSFIGKLNIFNGM